MYKYVFTCIFIYSEEPPLVFSISYGIEEHFLYIDIYMYINTYTNIYNMYIHKYSEELPLVFSISYGIEEHPMF
jgi:hypothetical protein